MLSFSSLFYVKNIENKYVITRHIQIICKNKQSIIFFLQLSFIVKIIALLFIPENKIKRKSVTCRLLSEKSALLKLNN